MRESVDSVPARSDGCRIPICIVSIAAIMFFVGILTVNVSLPPSTEFTKAPKPSVTAPLPKRSLENRECFIRGMQDISSKCGRHSTQQATETAEHSNCVSTTIESTMLCMNMRGGRTLRTSEDYCQQACVSGALACGLACGATAVGAGICMLGCWAAEASCDSTCGAVYE